jgi:hypothetical protein
MKNTFSFLDLFGTFYEQLVLLKLNEIRVREVDHSSHSKLAVVVAVVVAMVAIQ